MENQHSILEELRQAVPGVDLLEQATCDSVPTVWVGQEHVKRLLGHLKNEIKQPYRMLYDLCAIDERARRTRPEDQPDGTFSIAYHLLSMERNADVRVKVALEGEYPSIQTITDLWPNANWYEREVWDMFGIKVEGHPCLRRILNPPNWVGHPLRKDYPARATDLPGYELPEGKDEEEQLQMQFHPEHYGMKPAKDGVETMFLNFGPHHPGTHGLLRIVLQLDGEEIVDQYVDVGFHHRAAEKMAERQTFHTYIPYTDRVDYQAGLQNELPYLLSLEKLGGIDVPERAQVIRVMLCELFRIINHLVYLGTYAVDVGALSPVFFTFNDRERGFDIVEAICGGRMHPAWFRIGGVASDLPQGWEALVDDFLTYMPARLDEYEKVLTKTRIFKQRTKGVGVYTTDSAIEWGVTGPNLRSAGSDWDLRKKRPYSGYEQFEFDVPVTHAGDSFDRALVRIQEMRESLKIMRQAMDNMPAGSYRSDHRLAMPPRKEETMQAIETLINHFLSVSWGQPMPVGECMISTEAPKGNYGYYITSDGSNWAYRCHIRTASFPHTQSLPVISNGLLVSDLITILGSIDFVLSDVDR